MPIMNVPLFATCCNGIPHWPEMFLETALPPNEKFRPADTDHRYSFEPILPTVELGKRNPEFPYKETRWLMGAINCAPVVQLPIVE